MNNLDELMVNIDSVWVPFEGQSPFEVQLSYIPRTEMTKLVESCQETKMSRSTRQMEKTLNSEKFLSKFVDRAIVSWKGLELQVLENFIPIRYEEGKEKEELKFSRENAIKLLKESQLFDDWVNEKISDIDTFRQ